MSQTNDTPTFASDQAHELIAKSLRKAGYIATPGRIGQRAITKLIRPASTLFIAQPKLRLRLIELDGHRLVEVTRMRPEKTL